MSIYDVPCPKCQGPIVSTDRTKDDTIAIAACAAGHTFTRAQAIGVYAQKHALAEYYEAMKPLTGPRKQMNIQAAYRLHADWWSSMSSQQQDVYIKEHPRSKKAKEAKDIADEAPAKPVQKRKPVAPKQHVTGPAAHKAVKHDLDAMEVMGLKTYSSDNGKTSFYKEINNDLRSGKELSPTAANITRNLDQTFASAETTEPIEVYRGLDGKFAASLTKGASFVDNGFASTTSSDKVAKSFAGGDDAVVMKISVPKGSKAVSMGNVSDYPEEQEILLNRGGTYTIKNITVENGVKTIHVEYK